MRHRHGPLTILQVGYALAPVGPDAVGGSEQILSALDRTLVSAGHRSVVVACEGSVAAGELVPFPAAREPILPEVEHETRERRRAALATALRSYPVDLVHMHGLDFWECLPPPGPPVLATLHLPPDWYPNWVFGIDRPGTWLNPVSASQAALCPQSHLLVPPVLNGVPVRELARARPQPRGHALMLSRVCPEKGLHLALDAARRADVELLIGGELFPYPAHQNYYAEEVQPRLDDRRRWLGPLGFRRKRALLASAGCLLVPSLVAETSSLVAMEAAACGTPVIAFRSGALPEVVEDGRTGFLVDGVEEMADAIGRAGQLDRRTIRAVARGRFARDRMAATYIERYQELVGDRLAAAA